MKNPIHWPTLFVGTLFFALWAEAADVRVDRFQLRAAPGVAKLDRVGENPTLYRVNIEKLAEAKENWKVTFEQTDLPVKKGDTLVLKVRMRAEVPRTIACRLYGGTGNRLPVGLDTGISIDQDFRTIRVRFTVTQDDPKAVLRFSLGGFGGAVEFSEVSLLPPAPLEPGMLDADAWRLRSDTAAGALGVLDHLDEVSPVLRTTIKSLSAKRFVWDVGLIREDIKVEGDQIYVLGFRARADAERRFRVLLTQGKPPRKILGIDREFVAGTDWKPIGIRFKAKDTDDAAILHIQMGNSSVPIEFTDFSLRKGDANKSEGIDPADWQLITGRESRAELQTLPESPGVVRVAIDKVDLSRSVAGVAIQCPTPEFKKDESYQITFRARARAPRSIDIAVLQDHQPWQPIGLRKLIMLSQDWQNYTETFAAKLDESTATIRLSMGHSDVDVDIGDFTLKPIDTIDTTPNRRSSLLANAIGGMVMLCLSCYLVARIKKARSELPAPELMTERPVIIITPPSESDVIVTPPPPRSSIVTPLPPPEDEDDE